MGVFMTKERRIGKTTLYFWKESYVVLTANLHVTRTETYRFIHTEFWEKSASSFGSYAVALV